MEELDLMESTAKEIYSDDDVEVFRMKKQHFQAAKKYLVCLNLSKYSVEDGEEFEITLNKTTDHSIISQIKEFTLEEIPISNYERSLSAMNILSENYLNVHFIISRSTLLLYGLKRDVSSVKIDLLAQLRDPDEINMGMTDCTAKSFGGKAATGQSSQEKDSIIKQTKNYPIKNKPINSDNSKISTHVESTSVEVTSVESTYVENNSIKSTLIHRREKDMCKRSEPGLSHLIKEIRPQFYTGHKTNLKVYVRKENITQLDVDIIVNAANRHLRHAGGVSRAVALAAGQSLVKECNSYIDTHGPLDVTDVFVSTGGLLRATYVMHAVGPKWQSYEDKNLCLKDLRRTIVRCLVEASRLQKGSVALPSISSAIFKVPKDLCAQCYMQAVKHFDDFAEKLGVVPVKDVRFVDVDDVMVNIILEKFIKEWHKPVDGKFSKEDFEFSQQHLSNQYDDTFGCSTGSSAFQKKYQQPSSQGTNSEDESHKMVSQGSGANTIGYQVNSIQIHIVTKPATVYRSAIVVVGQLFDELSGKKKFNVCDLVKPRSDLPKQNKSFRYLSLSKPDGSQPILICKLHPNPDNPENVTKAFENLDNAEEIHRSDTVVFTSTIFYIKPKKVQGDFKIISRIAQKVFDFAAVISSTNSSIKSIIIATGADCIPQIIKLFDSRNIQKIPHGQTSRAGNQGTGGYPATSSGYPATSGVFAATSGGYPTTSGGYPTTSGGYTTTSGGNPTTSGGYPTTSGGYPTTSGGYPTTSGGYPTTSGGYPTTSGGYPTTSGGYPKTSGGYPTTSGGYPTTSGGYIRKAGGSPDYSSAYKAIPGFKQDLVSSVDSQDCCSVCFERINIESLKCCQGLICSTCLGKVSICPYCRFHFKILIGKQPPNGDMRWKYSAVDVHGYERKGSIVIDYYIPPGKQTEELQHPSPGKPYSSVNRTAYLPATDDGYRALRLLIVAFHRRLIFTIDVSHTTLYEGIIWNIHHKTSGHSSEHGYPDPKYLMNLMSELCQNGVTEDSMTQEERRLVDELMACFRKNTSTRV